MKYLRHWPGVALLALAGCASVDEYRAPRVDMPDTHPVLPQVAPPPATANGAIFQAGAYRPLFEDHRARLPGDTLTVQIVEAVSASQKSTSSVDKSGQVSAGVSSLPLINRDSPLLGRLGAGANSSNTFAGQGATESSNDFSGTITAMVTGVLPNGHLLITGEKQIGVNANVDVLRFSGQVDPRAILAGNVVPSSRIANVRLEHRSRGQQADAQLMGLLGRFFLSVLPF
ncbi:flagellar basal body L-ring protein FlgH [Azohydromonas caseinilytica]|uniref:Flagellar L-ring protein n=1 Tax=Azohydromonas caseinilytica TaxID=2728836 RepID=A0A848F8S6_9BURK|nr:flagellar basal body L-ring protein FlgH [Azohydromonas caseinilytica]NML14909.1 flagellar basal body L-ring protein FlgH [Azohydromonas caseinilytica]